MIGEDILITRSINQSAEASNAVRQALDAMLTISKHINLGEDIIKNINLLKEQYDSKKAKSVMQQVYEFEKEGLQIWVWRNKIRTVFNI